MANLVKFRGNYNLEERLLDTGEDELIEAATVGSQPVGDGINEGTKGGKLLL